MRAAGASGARVIHDSDRLRRPADAVARCAGLVIPGQTLSPLIGRLGLGEEEAVAREEARARVQLAHAALRRIEESSRM